MVAAVPVAVGDATAVGVGVTAGGGVAPLAVAEVTEARGIATAGS